jgi:uncharacterized membrane protein
MAGIGFELRRMIRKDTYWGLLRAYAYAGIISSGPWLLSIIAILILGILSNPFIVPTFLITQFQTSLTYLIAVSLILTGALQLSFTRYVSDRLFEQERDRVFPNFNGVSLVTTAASGTLAFPFALLFFPDQSPVFRLLFAASFVVLCNIWIATTLLSGLKAYRTIVILFAGGYTITIVFGMLFRLFGLEGLLGGFFIGQFLLLVGMYLTIAYSYQSDRFIEFDFFAKGKLPTYLILPGLFYNAAIWADKFIFWFHPNTSQPIVGPLRASLIYDFPIFLAYLSIVPGMAVFLVRMETDFVEYYDKFYDAVREGGSLQYIRDMHDEMVQTAREGIFDIMKIQSLACLACFIAGPAVLKSLGISELYLPLLYVDLVSAGMQVVLLGILNINFYLNRKIRVLTLTALLFALNALFTAITIAIGPFFFGYGFAASLLITVAVGMVMLNRDFDLLEYETFMLQ